MYWRQKSYSVSSGIHILKWRYIDGDGDSGDNCGWVDFTPGMARPRPVDRAPGARPQPKKK